MRGGLCATRGLHVAGCTAGRAGQPWSLQRPLAGMRVTLKGRGVQRPAAPSAMPHSLLCLDAECLVPFIRGGGCLA